ncbi:MAG: polymorphic toxin-type HINT domain-containing protein, partial [Candidatus Thiodiazotropha sp.]
MQNDHLGTPRFLTDAYARQNPLIYSDLSGNFLPLIFAGMAIYSAISTAYEVTEIGYGLYTEVKASDLAGDLGKELAINLALKAVPGGAAVVAAKKMGIFKLKKLLPYKETRNKIDDLAEGTRGRCCFVAGTQVLSESGYKPIEQVKEGERLWAKDVETGEQGWKAVNRVYVEADREVYEITLAGEGNARQRIEATDDHPFYVLGKGWKKTVELTVGDRLETDETGTLTVLSVIDEKRTDVTYNFEI